MITQIFLCFQRISNQCNRFLICVIGEFCILQNSPKKFLTSVETFDTFHPFSYGEPTFQDGGKKGRLRMNNSHKGGDGSV